MAIACLVFIADHQKANGMQLTVSLRNLATSSYLMSMRISYVGIQNHAGTVCSFYSYNDVNMHASTYSLFKPANQNFSFILQLFLLYTVAIIMHGQFISTDTKCTYCYIAGCYIF